MARRSAKRAARQNSRRTRIAAYMLLLVLVISAYIGCQYFFEWAWLTESVTTVVAIISVVTFLIEYNENKHLNEFQFITELNDQFIGNENMSEIEWELEKFYYKHRNGELTDEYIESFRKSFDIEQKSRQKLVNYLEHLESIATLVDNKVLHLDKISDLMSYRYFIALNNPIVQELEIIAYADFYRGCLCIYEKWVKVLQTQGVEIPMFEDYGIAEFCGKANEE
ncbi:MAG: hypothetical protein E7595_00345 [Ruminococcaceae bacterium]|nr:hypothetical protein [Oscillospiraceae bacterium]